jgi:shikimate kinase
VSAESRPALVELVGLAGAGKSTLAHELTAVDPSVQVGLPLSRARSAAAQATVLAPFAVTWMREARGTPWFDRDQARGIGYLSAWRPPARRPNRHQVVVLDHGPLFRLAQLDAFGPPVTATAAFRRWRERLMADWVDRLHLVVWLDAPRDLLIRRIRSREQRHVLRGADDDTSLVFLERYRAAYDGILAEVHRRSPDTVLSLRTDHSPPEALASQVLDRLAGEARLDG